jgi:serine/threonine-protein phosphatase 6 regulatory ankyrin repeat subunit B
MKAPNAFVEAVLNADFHVAKELLASGIDINARYGENGWTALHHAVEHLSVESTTWLLENGAGPNHRDSSGGTPLHLSIDSESDFEVQQWPITGVYAPSAKLVALLVQHGADPNAGANDGTTPLAIAHSYRNLAAIEILKRYGATDSGNV